MRIFQKYGAAILALFLTLGLASAGLAYEREVLRQFKEKTLMAPEFTLKDMTSKKTYSLKDYRDKMWVILETGSST